MKTTPIRSKRKSQILKLLQKENVKNLSEGSILRALGMPEKKRQHLRTTLANMVMLGILKKTSRGKYRVKEPDKKLSKNTKDRTLGIKDATKTKRSGKPQNNEEPLPTHALAKVKKTASGFIACPRNPAFDQYDIRQKNGESFSDGELVIVKIDTIAGLAIVKEHLGISGDIDTEKKGILREYDLPKRFPRDVTKETSAFTSEFSDSDLSKRVILEKETIFTIDGDDAKDFDDAVGIKRTKRRGYRLWVNIADVSHYVTFGSACDKEARRRATSTYLSDRVVPMLPQKLSNDLCSLRPDRTRLTKTVEMEFDSSGKFRSSRIYNSVIKSCARLTYSRVADVFEGKDRKTAKNIVSSLLNMKELYLKLKKRRIDNGGLDFDFPEAVILRDSVGEISDIIRYERNAAHEVIEEFMIMANSIVAAFIFEKGFESIYRIHESPDQTSLDQLRENLRKMGLKIDFSSKTSQVEIQSVMKAASGRKDEEQVNIQILRALKKAVYSTRHVPHFGLAINDYTHFTSPIRRYPDLVVHRIVDDILKKKEPSYGPDNLKSIAEYCSEAERRAEDAERQFMNLETAHFMKVHVGRVFNGKVVSIHPFGVFIEIKEHFVEGLIPEHSYKGRGRKRKWFELGDEVRVKLVDADTEKRRLTFTLAS